MLLAVEKTGLGRAGQPSGKACAHRIGPSSVKRRCRPSRWVRAAALSPSGGGRGCGLNRSFPQRFFRPRIAMKTVLLASDREPDAPLARRCRLRHRVRAHVRALKLDRALAAGQSPASELLLSLRAETMISMANRHALAQALRRAVTDAARP